jgi:hypothetical protein
MPNIGPFELLVLLLFFGAPITLVVMAVRRSLRDPCWHCGQRVKPGTPSCPACGAQFPAAQKG